MQTEGQLSRIFNALLQPAHWLAGQVGLPVHLPAVELAVGLVFMASCFGLALVAIYFGLRSRKPLPFAAALVSLAAGIIGLLGSVLVSDVWLYVLVLAIVTADIYWRLVSKGTLPKPLRRTGTLWAAAALVLTAGTPTLFLVHTWYAHRQANSTMLTVLTSERDQLSGNGLTKLGESMARLSQEPDLLQATKTVGDPLLVSLLQRMSIQEQIPYLTLLTSDKIVLARTEPAAANGDSWPVTLSPFMDKATGLTLSERNIPVLLVADRVGTGTSSPFLVGGIQLDQSYFTERLSTTSYPLFTVTDVGITALAAKDGKVLNVLSAQSIDTLLADSSDKATLFTVTDGTDLFLVRTLPITATDGTIITTLGTAYQDTGSAMRLRLDLIVMMFIAALIIVVPSVIGRRKKEKKA